jgi:hypothetical protein
VDERERQRRSREGRRAETCHEPPSARKAAQLRAEMLEFWDNTMALSRASLVRRLPALMRVSMRSAGTAQGP